MNPLADQFSGEQRWVSWRNEQRDGKLTKIPYSQVGRPAKANDPATWVVRAAAEQTAKRLINGKGSGGIGIQLGDLGHDVYLGGLDLDSCIESGGTLAPWATSLLAAVPSYAERSPSGRGIKVFFYAMAEHVRPFLDLIGAEKWGTRRSIGDNSADHGPAVELYLRDRYFAVTGEAWEGREQLVLLGWPALERLATLIPPAHRPQAPSSGASTGGDRSRSALAYKLGGRLRRAGKSYEEFVAAAHADVQIAEWARTKGEANRQREFRRIWEKVAPVETLFGRGGVSLDDFWAYMPTHTYMFAPAREFWPASSVKSRIPPVSLLDAGGQPILGEDGKPLKTSSPNWLDKHKPVEQMTWAPGMPMIIKDRLTSEGGWIMRNGVSCFNLYRPPLNLPGGDPEQAGKWIDHVAKVYPEEHEQIRRWLAHRVQRPEEKINHALVLGGSQGIGKDSLLEPVKRAIAPWNWEEVGPREVLGTFNKFAKSVILRVNEARDLGEISRFQFYDHMKSYIAAPPDVLRVNEKHVSEYYILNCCGVIITTNHKADGLFIPPDDRRHFVCWSNLTKEHFNDAYWDDLWNWYNSGGDRHVRAYLATLDISEFKPKAPPPKTAAFWDIVNSHRASEDAELDDILDTLERPKALTLSKIVLTADATFAEWLNDRKNRRAIPHRLEACGYTPVRNPDAADGLWKIGKRQVIYASASISRGEQIDAARELLPRSSGDQWNQ